MLLAIFFLLYCVLSKRSTQLTDMKRDATGVAVLPGCANVLRENRDEMHRTKTECAALRWDYSPQTIQRALLCAFDLHVANATPKRMHLYVREGDIAKANSDKLLRCFLESKYKVEVTLLYPVRPRELPPALEGVVPPLSIYEAREWIQTNGDGFKNALAAARRTIPQPLPQVAGGTPRRGLTVGDVPAVATFMSAAETIRFDEERTEIFEKEFEYMLNLVALPPHMPR